MSTATTTYAAWNPRYVQYARAHGMTPVDMAVRDVATYPGGCMAGYIGWIGERWVEWNNEQGRTGNARHNHDDADHVAFDAWLVGRVDAAIAAQQALAEPNGE